MAPLALGLAGLAGLAALFLLSGSSSSSSDRVVRPKDDDDDDAAIAKEAKREVEAKKAKVIKESTEIIHGKRDAYSDDMEEAAKAAVIEHEKQLAKEAKDAASAKERAAAEKRKQTEADKKIKAAAADKALTKQPVSSLQRIVRALGAPSKGLTDGKYGPKTERAWQAEAKERGLKTTIQRVDATSAKVDRGAFESMQRAANAALAPRPTPQPTPGPEPQHEPAKPISPPGYDPAKARAGARALANHLRGKGKSGYDRKLVAQWQTWAGIPSDKIYGGGTRGALIHYGVRPADAPAPFFQPFETLPYTPPA